jgi:hypothetical protein
MKVQGDELDINGKRTLIGAEVLPGAAPHDRALRRVGFQRRRIGWHKLMLTRLVLMSERTQTFLSEGTPNSFSVLGR